MHEPWLKNLLSMVVSQHRSPEYIKSDYNLQFCGHFWNELVSLLKTKLTFSMISHPQTDGMTVVTNPYYGTAIQYIWVLEKLGVKVNISSYAY